MKLTHQSELLLNNCTLAGNSAEYGGGVFGTALNNCIVYFNTAATNGANWYDAYTVNHCCTTPMPNNGVGNMTNAPLFVAYHTIWQEWRCQTDPTNALFVLRLLSASRAGTNLTVRWQSVAGVNYFLERSTNLWARPPFSLLARSLPASPARRLTPPPTTPPQPGSFTVWAWDTEPWESNLNRRQQRERGRCGCGRRAIESGGR